MPSASPPPYVELPRVRSMSRAFESFGFPFWRIRMERADGPDLCFQLTLDVFRANSRQSFAGVAKLACASDGFK